MKLGNVEVPEEILLAHQEGNLVIFAGAGVSKPPPSSLPLFGELVDQIAEGTNLLKEEGESLDRYLGRLAD